MARITQGTPVADGDVAQQVSSGTQTQAALRAAINAAISAALTDNGDGTAVLVTS